MEVRTFTRIKKVIWDQLLATEAEIIEGKLYFRFACENPNATFLNKLRLELQSVIFGRFYPAEVIFSSKLLKNSSKKTLPFNFQLSGPDYMSRAGPVSRDDVGLPGSRHVC